MDNGIFITAARIASLPKAEQSYLFGLMLGTAASQLDQDGKSTPPSNGQLNAVADDEDDDDLAELSPRQARDFYQGCGDKTKRAVEAIAKGDGPTFNLSDVATALGVDAGDLRGVWGGLTRRTQTIVGDADAYLIYWHDGTQKYDANDNYIDQVGEVAEMTYASFRKALKL